MPHAESQGYLFRGLVSALLFSLIVSCAATQKQMVKSILEPYVPPGKLAIVLVPQIINCVISHEANKKQTLPLGFSYEIVESGSKLMAVNYKNEFHKKDSAKNKDFETCTSDAVAETNRLIEYSAEEMKSFHQLKNLNYSHITVEGVFLTRSNVKAVMSVLNRKENKVFTHVNSLIRINSTLDLNYLYHFGADVTWFSCAKDDDCVTKAGFCDSYAVNREFSSEADQFLEENIQKKYKSSDCPVSRPEEAKLPPANCIKNTCIIER
ncbi:MAG: hypothetical protein K2Q26_01755 [Bdellovibrionales bacterium]|nr:hypothetical protein [Bdellovibrionales bacterium]